MEKSMLAQIGSIKISEEKKEIILPSTISAKVIAFRSGSKKIKFEVKIFGDDTKLYSDKQIIAVPDGYCSKESITAWRDAVKNIYKKELEALIIDKSFVESLVRKNSLIEVEFDNDESTDKSLRDWILR